RLADILDAREDQQTNDAADGRPTNQRQMDFRQALPARRFRSTRAEPVITEEHEREHRGAFFRGERSDPKADREYSPFVAQVWIARYVGSGFSRIAIGFSRIAIDPPATAHHGEHEKRRAQDFRSAADVTRRLRHHRMDREQ